MIIVVWPLVIATTAILYSLVLLSLPFSVLHATIFLFSLVAFWSKLPGYCIGEPLPVIYSMDLVDLFVIIIAAHINIFYAAIFALIWNIFPRVCGGYKPWPGITKDAISMAILALFVPLFSIFAGGNLLIVVLIFSILRYPLMLLICFFIPHFDWVTQIVRVTVAAVSLLFVNILYAKWFGTFFENLVQDGAVFSWVLFLVATIVILAFAILFMGLSPKQMGNKAMRNIINITKKQKRTKTNIMKDDEDMKFIKEISREFP